MRKIFTLSTMLLALGAQAQIIADEYQTYDEHNRDLYRHVISYNAAKERASETVYRKHKSETGEWQTEELVTRGVYTYEYDSKGRMTMKQLKYENDEYLDSYRIYITYNDNETIYTKYELSEDNDLDFWHAWGTYTDGKQSFTTVAESEYRHDEDFYMRYDHDGNIIERGYVIDEGTSAPVVYRPRKKYKWNGTEEQELSYYDGATNHTYFHYDDKARLVECYRIYDGYRGMSGRILYTYDNLGRVTKQEVFNLEWDEDDEEMVDVIPSHKENQVLGDKELSWDIDREYHWQLESVEEFTYATDEVYGMTSSWYNGFGFCGPVSLYKYTEYDDEGEIEEYDSGVVTFNRDSNGKLLSVTYDMGDSFSPTVIVDDKGHIVKTAVNDEYWENWNEQGEWVDEPIYAGYSKEEMNYTWEGDNLVKVENSYEYFNKMWMEQPESSYESYTLTYADGSVTMQDPYESSTLETGNGRIKVTRKSSYDTEYAVAEKQTETVRFALRRPYEETIGLGLDSVKVLSRKGRVVHVSTNRDSYNSDAEYLVANDIEQGYMLMPNIAPDDYFHIVKEGDVAYCYDIADRITYVVKGELLIKEYVYNEEYELSPIEPGDRNNSMRAGAFNSNPSGSCYIREYIYDDKGNLMGIKVSEQDKNGNVSEDYKLTYTYDPATGIRSISTAQGFSLNGRTLGTRDNVRFSIYDLNGRPIASSVDTFTFDAPGTYIMKSGNKSVKVNVK